MKIGLLVGSRVDPIEQARSALDELIKALGAERAFIFTTDEDGKFNLMLGRNLQQEDLSGVEGYSRTVIESIAKSKTSVLLTADEHGETVHSDSIISQNLKSIIACPMLLEDHLEGVIYLDNRLVKGIFTNEDLQLLQAIGNQIAVARKSVRTALHVFEEKQVRLNLARYLPISVVTDIMAGSLQLDQSPRYMSVAVLFSDLVGFTKLLASISAPKASIVLNRYLDRMINIIFENGGTIDKFVGDAIMVVFGAPVEIPPQEQARKAINCATAMQNALRELNESWRSELGIEDVRMRIGVHHGPVLIGNFGNDRRMQYTAFGNTVNIAARIQSMCEPDQVYFSQVVCDYIVDPNIRKIGSVLLKGVADPVTLYSVGNR